MSAWKGISGQKGRSDVNGAHLQGERSPPRAASRACCGTSPRGCGCERFSNEYIEMKEGADVLQEIFSFGVCG